jgi:hypothetical protein
MVADTLRQHFGDDYKEAFRLLPLARIVCMSGDMRSAVMPETVRDFAKKHGIDIEV